MGIMLLISMLRTAMATCTNTTGVVINEFLYDPAGTDTGHEWIELYNSGSTVDISGWMIKAGASVSSFSTKATFPANTMFPANSYLLIGESSVAADLGITPTLVSTLGLGNTSTGVDGVQLLNASGNCLDTVLYGTGPDTEGWSDDNGANPTSFAPEATSNSGQTVSRIPNGTDTNQSGSDFQITTPTPVAQNTSSGGGGGGTCSNSVLSGVLINEVVYNPSGTDTGHEWVEIYNNTGSVVDVSGWKIQAGTSSFSDKGTFASGQTIGVGGYLLVGESIVSTDLNMTVDLVTTLSMGNGTSNIDGVRLVDCNNAVLDTVLYGTAPDTEGWSDDNGANPTSFAPKVDGQSISRIPNGRDTNQSGSDFQATAYTPKAGNSGGSSTTTCTNTVLSGVLINEVVYNPSGTDTDHEWIEIYNNTGSVVDVSGWKIQAGTSSFSDKGTFASGQTIGVGGYLLVGESSVSTDLNMTVDLVTTLSMGNGTSNIDGVRLVDCNNAVLDTVLYGTGPDTEGWSDDNGANPTSFAPKVDGQSISRIPNGTDTNQSAADFQATNMTAGAENTGGGGNTTTCENVVFSGVVINELLYNPSGSDSGHEWIELANNTSFPVDISGWAIQAGTSSFSTKGTFAANTFIPANSYVLIGESDVSVDLGRTPELVVSLGMGNVSSGVDGVRLVDCNAVVIDTVLYGAGPDTDGWSDDNGTSPTSFAPVAGDGEAIGRIPDGVDSNQSNADFDILAFPTPWVANDAETFCEGQTFVKINEFIPNPHTVLPDGTEISDDEGREWIELYNIASVSVDLSGWKLQWGGNPSYSGGEFVFPQGSSIGANDYLLIGGELVEGADVVVPLTNDLDMTLASSNADALRLLHCGPGVADTVVYGPSENGIATNPDMILDDTETVATSAAPKPQEGLSIARYIDGRDTNQSGVDFTVSVDNTPGSPNPEIVCGDGDFQVKINEIIPNPDGTDSGQEWIELYNAGTADVRLDAWKIEVASSSWSTKVTLPYDITISPGQFFLIGESDVPPEFADYRIDSSLSLGNASTGLDGVRLVNCLGGIEDTLLYGKVGAVLDPEEELFDDQGNSTFAFLSDSGKTIGRSTDGVDTDDNAADFATNMVPTPRAANVGGSGDTGTNTTEVPSKGCNKSAEPSDSDPSKCSYVDGISPYLWVSTLFVLYRRRET